MSKTYSIVGINLGHQFSLAEKSELPGCLDSVLMTVVH
ncbi:MAG: hypothetical protein ACLS2X_07885 [Coprococcus sp.]